MVKSWYITADELVTNDELKRSKRHFDQPQFLKLDELKRKTGFTFEQLDPKKYETEGQIADICAQRGYKNGDIVEFEPKRTENFKKTVDFLYEEHIHAEDEVRLVLDGSGYIDVRDLNNRWIRIAISRGDLISVRHGSYHRFCLDHNLYIKVYRLFGETTMAFEKFNRPADQHPARVGWLKDAVKGF